MHRLSLVVAALLVPSVAHAGDPVELGGWFGPRIFSDKSVLGYINGAPAHPMLQNSIELGARAARRFWLPWLYPELELAFAPTHTNAVGGAAEATVYWLEPRAQLRIELMPGRRLQPFVVAGGGSPIALSTATRTFNSGIIGDGYAGAGVRFLTGRGFTLRFDARLAILPGVEPDGTNTITTELDIGLGIELALGQRRAAAEEEVPPSEVADRDADGIADAADKCPDRPEDKDGFEDGDGCPDIDNDGDQVLDIADKCPDQQETRNGFEDDDGCADSLPADVDGIRGTIEGLLYADGETAVHASAHAAIARIAKVLLARPSIKILLVGHTDDREAKAFVTPPAPGQPAQDAASIATDLARGRAEAVRQALVAAGVPQARIVIDGVGADDPVADNDTAKGRLANRRVELKLFVPN